VEQRQLTTVSVAQVTETQCALVMGWCRYFKLGIFSGISVGIFQVGSVFVVGF